MKNPNISKHFIFLLLMISSVVLPQSAFADYASSCSGCHSNSKLGKSYTSIQNAISNNVGGMGFLKTSLTNAQIDAIAVQGGNPPTCLAPRAWNTAGTTCVTPPVVTPPVVTPPVVTPPVVTPPVVTPPVVTPPVVTPPVVTPRPTNGDDDDNEDDHDSNNHGKSDENEKQHIHSGSVGKKTSGAAKTDSFQVTCAKGTKSLAVSVRDLNPRKDPELSIQAFKGKASTPLSTDKVDGDAKFSRIENLAAGAGTYTITVNKSSSKEKGSEAYTAKLNCQNANGSTAISDLKTLKDQ